MLDAQPFSKKEEGGQEEEEGKKVSKFT